jgi:3-oxoacyl-[acyl-carrier-protein] synthase III
MIAAMPSTRVLSYAAQLGALSTVARPADAEHFPVHTTDDPLVLARSVAADALAQAQLLPGAIDCLLFVGALSRSHHRPSGSNSVLGEFCYAGSWLQNELTLDRARVLGIAQQGCGGMFGAIAVADALLRCTPGKILIVGSDMLPPDAPRTILGQPISDAAAAVILSSSSGRFRLAGTEQITKGFYWNVPASSAEILASYFPSAREVVRRLLTRLDLTADDIDLIIPTGIQRDSWDILADLWKIPPARCFHPAQTFGHTIQADSFLVLQEAERAGAILPGMRLLFFTFGFGSTWCAMVWEVTE